MLGGLIFKQKAFKKTRMLLVIDTPQPILCDSINIITPTIFFTTTPYRI